METIWCQWSDLELPAGFKLLTDPADLTDPAKLAEITIFIPPYMGGAASLAAMTQMPNLKLVQLLTAGFEDALRVLPNGVVLANARGVHDLSTAELTLALTLASKSGLDQYLKGQSEQSWLRGVRDSIIDNKIAIIGFGSVGREIARVFQPFTSNIVGYTRSGSNGSKKMAELDQDLADYDIVVLITPLTDETRGLFNLERMKLMKPGALLVNMARGPVVVTQDLITALNSGQIKAALDVTDPEPLPKDHPLWHAPNLIISPHVGGNSTAFPKRAKNLLNKQLNRLANGEPVENVVA